jgi:colanic acid biosynthesis glycosyl transferase WcaI
VRILFLNQYFPPDPAPTGVLLHELGEHLRAQGHEVEFVSSRQDYRYAKKNRGRMVRELRALTSIFFQAVQVQKPDVVFSASSPPCLVVAAALVALRHRAKGVHWLMDLYPEIAVTLGEIKPGPLPWLIEKLTGWAYRRCALVVGLDADMAARLEKYGVAAEIIRPWVLQSLLNAAPENEIAPDAEWTWIYSGNLGRAHEWETLLQTQAILEKRGSPWRLLFQGGGPSWPLAQARATELGLRRCDWKPYATEQELQTSLLRCRVLAVTQRPETRGLLWPSKLAMVSNLPRPVLFVGPVDGAIARELQKLPHAGVFAPGDAVQIASWLDAVRADGGFAITPPAQSAAQKRALALEKWVGLLRAL